MLATLEQVYRQAQSLLENMAKAVRRWEDASTADAFDECIASMRAELGRLKSLAGLPFESSGPIQASKAPSVSRATAQEITALTQELMSVLEREILDSLEELSVSMTVRSELAVTVGAILAVLFAEIQQPLWRQYPDLAPRTSTRDRRDPGR